MDAQTLMNRFQEFWSNSEFCDYSITTCDDVVFNVHKTYMAAVSDYFYAMLNSSNEMIESQTNSIKLWNVTSLGLSPVLDFVYGKVDINLTIANITDVLNAASMLQIKEMFRKCQSFLFDNVDEENYIEMRKLCSQFSMIDTVNVLDIKIIESGFLNKIVSGEQVDEYLAVVDEELFLKLIMKSSVNPVAKNTYINMHLQRRLLNLVSICTTMHSFCFAFC